MILCKFSLLTGEEDQMTFKPIAPPEVEALGRRAAACTLWYWKPGMRVWFRGVPYRITANGNDAYSEDGSAKWDNPWSWEKNHGDPTDWFPDLRDEATLGVIVFDLLIGVDTPQRSLDLWEFAEKGVEVMEQFGIRHSALVKE